MNKMNYQKELEKILIELDCKTEDADVTKKIPTLLLHSCCAPCSSYVLEYLSQYFRITVFYYNPNISEQEEYEKRVEEQKRLINKMNEVHILENVHRTYPIDIIEGDYVPQRFLEQSKGLETCAEGGIRCFQCYELRLNETANIAKERKADYFATTLTISPLKNAEKINEIGYRLAARYQINWLPSDFKKKEGYKQSIELSKEYELYRQNYCGCIYSKLTEN